MSDAKDGFRLYFDKLIKAWHDQFGSRPKLPFDDELDSELLVGDPDEDDLIEWLPQKVVHRTLSNQIGDCSVSQSVVEYFDSYRFLAAGGKVGDFAIQLSPITNWFLADELPRRIAGYRDTHGGILSNVPIGIETKTGRVVVIANSTDSAAVYVEDDETLGLTRLADSPHELLVQLEPVWCKK